MQIFVPPEDWLLKIEVEIPDLWSFIW